MFWTAYILCEIRPYFLRTLFWSWNTGVTYFFVHPKRARKWKSGQSHQVIRDVALAERMLGGKRATVSHEVEERTPILLSSSATAFYNWTPFCDFIVCGFNDQGGLFINERVMQDKEHWENNVHSFGDTVSPWNLRQMVHQESNLLRQSSSPKAVYFCRMDTGESLEKMLQSILPDLSFPPLSENFSGAKSMVLPKLPRTSWVQKEEV